MTESVWRKSTYSHGEALCVEVAFGTSEVHVRDSKNPQGSVLVFTHAEWDAFTAGAKDGEFDI